MIKIKNYPKLPKMNQEELNKLNDRLEYGDIAEIARRAGISRTQAKYFFDGSDSVAPETITKILKATGQVFRNRERLKERNEQLLKSL